MCYSPWPSGTWQLIPPRPLHCLPLSLQPPPLASWLRLAPLLLHLPTQPFLRSLQHSHPALSDRSFWKEASACRCCPPFLCFHSGHTGPLHPFLRPSPIRLCPPRSTFPLPGPLPRSPSTPPQESSLSFPFGPPSHSSVHHLLSSPFHFAELWTFCPLPFLSPCLHPPLFIDMCVLFGYQMVSP